MKYFVFDTETSALIKNTIRPLEKQPHVVEFYGCVWDTDIPNFNSAGHPVPIQEIEFICKPPVKCEPDAEAAHRLTEETLSRQPPFSAFAYDVQKMIEGCDGVVAHNLAYDYNMIENEMRRAGRRIAWPIRRICTVENTEHINGYRMSLGRNKKGEPGLYHYLFGEDFPEAHRAKPDTLALLRCFVELLKRGVL